MKLSAERLREIAIDGFLEHGDAKLMARELLVNREAQPVQVTDGMALDFHHALTDSDIGKDDLEEIKIGLRAALCNVNALLTPRDAQPAAWSYEWASCITCEGPQNFKPVIEREAPPQWAINEGQARNVTLLYAAPPAPANLQPVAWEMRYWNSGHGCWHDWERITEEKYAELSVAFATDSDHEFRTLYSAQMEVMRG